LTVPVALSTCRIFPCRHSSGFFPHSLLLRLRLRPRSSWLGGFYFGIGSSAASISSSGGGVNRCNLPRVPFRTCPSRCRSWYYIWWRRRPFRISFQRFSVCFYV
jgi:hypothetical protein